MARKFLIVAADAAMYVAALMMAYWIRFDGRPPGFELRQMITWLPFVALACGLVNWTFGVYQRMWRYVSIFDCMVLAVSTGAMSAMLLLLRMFLTPEHQLFRPALGVIAANFMIASAGTIGIRIVTRLFFEYRQGKRPVWITRKDPGLLRVLLVGAGMAGILVAKEIRSSSKLKWSVFGFVDDDLSKRNTIIHGIRVRGRTEDIPRLVQDNKIDKVVVTIARASAAQIRRILEICEAVPVQTQIIPGLMEILDEKQEISKVRDLRIDDLLGRDVVRISESATEMSICFRNKTILISGAGGSIGGELCRQLALLSPRMLVLVDKDENSIFETGSELKSKFPFANTKSFIADLRNRERLGRVFADVHPDVVFHAAAHKHVPLMEENVFDAVDNNVFGTVNLIDACREFGVGRFVMLSTDKAVDCANVMGATKRISELFIQRSAANNSRTKFACVRFGNVLASRGSVVPIFQRQIADGGPITITHPETTRYFMTIPEASQLVIQAASLGEKGEIFILEMGKPIKILNLARDLIHLSGLRENEIEIRFTGLRPGEKLHENLVYTNETARKTKFGKIMVVDPLQIDHAAFDSALDGLRQALRAADDAEIRKVLFQTLETMQPRVVIG
jgi:FlaA1/EpsC-like NDP-sugar epimerase